MFSNQCKFIVFIRTLETLYPERVVCRFFLIIPDFDLISDIRNWDNEKNSNNKNESVNKNKNNDKYISVIMIQKTTAKKKNIQKDDSPTLPPIWLNYRDVLPSVNVFLFSYCCGLTFNFVKKLLNSSGGAETINFRHFQKPSNPKLIITLLKYRHHPHILKLLKKYLSIIMIQKITVKNKKDNPPTLWTI